MVTRQVENQDLDDVKYFADAKYTVTVSQNDTIPLPDFVDTENLKFAALINRSTGAQITCTYAAFNVVTVTGACTNQECTLFVFGVRA